MGGFEKSLREIKGAELEDIAAGLLERLEGRAGGAKTAAQETAEAEVSASAGALLQAAEKLLDRAFAAFSAREKTNAGEDGAQELLPGRGGENGEKEALWSRFDADAKEALWSRSASGTEPGGRVRQVWRETGSAASPGGRFSASTESGCGGYRDMEQISEFFRRDARRYDGGFKRY